MFLKFPMGFLRFLIHYLKVFPIALILSHIICPKEANTRGDLVDLSVAQLYFFCRLHFFVGHGFRIPMTFGFFFICVCAHETQFIAKSGQVIPLKYPFIPTYNLTTVRNIPIILSIVVLEWQKMWAIAFGPFKSGGGGWPRSKVLSFFFFFFHRA